MQVIKRDGTPEEFNQAKIDRLDSYATNGLNVDLVQLKKQVALQIYPGMTTEHIFSAQILAASGLISLENPDYTFAAARYLLASIIKKVSGKASYPTLMETLDKAEGRLGSNILDNYGTENIAELDAAIDTQRDFQFDFYGLKNVVDRYLMRDDSGNLIELPQHWLMRVSMGLARADQSESMTAQAIRFYNLLSSFAYMASTPTLFNAGTSHSQLASCFLNTVKDQISSEPDHVEDHIGVSSEHFDRALHNHRFASIFGTIEESARLSKFSGGIGTDWTRVRASGSHIKSTNGTSAGVIPYLTIANNTAIAVNQGGKRKGSFAPYLEVWHPDFWDFCELKKEFGDDRTRTHDLYPAAWIPDLFMQRKEERGMWSFFAVDKYPELHELYGDAFKARYEELEAQGAYVRQVPALDLWKHILTNLFNTGHPWITFKDPCNERSPQKHVGVVHSSNLCTEITLNTSDTETAVCNLGSVNIARHIADGQVDLVKLRNTVRTAVEMLDNVIDLNYYPSERAERANLAHRAIGLGLMGETEAKAMLGIAFDSQESVIFSSMVMEAISYFAIEASADRAQEIGSYPSFEGSDWSKGLVPIDTCKNRLDLGEEGMFTDAQWDRLRAKVKQGMRNSNLMAIAPTATISSIVYTTPCIEPIYELFRSEGNISGTFLYVDPCVRHFKDLPAGHGLDKIAREIDQMWLVDCAAARQQWIDQSQSLNIFVKASTKGSELDRIYTAAHNKGLKTTYYLRGESNQKKAEPKPDKVGDQPAVQMCSIDNPNCEACQ